MKARWFWTDEGMEPNEQGDFVQASAYGELQRELESLQAAFRDVTTRDEFARSAMPLVSWHGAAGDTAADQCYEIADRMMNARMK